MMHSGHRMKSFKKSLMQILSLLSEEAVWALAARGHTGVSGVLPSRHPRQHGRRHSLHLPALQERRCLWLSMHSFDLGRLLAKVYFSFCRSYVHGNVHFKK